MKDVFGSIGVLTEVSFLYQQLCSPKEGNLDAVYPIFSYLQTNLVKNLGRVVYNPMYEPTDENVFEVVRRYLDLLFY